MSCSASCPTGRLTNSIKKTEQQLSAAVLLGLGPLCGTVLKMGRKEMDEMGCDIPFGNVRDERGTGARCVPRYFRNFYDVECLTWNCSEHLSFEQPSLSALLLFRSAVLGPRVLGLSSILLSHSDPYREIIP